MKARKIKDLVKSVVIVYDCRNSKGVFQKKHMITSVKNLEHRLEELNVNSGVKNVKVVR